MKKILCPLYPRFDWSYEFLSIPMTASLFLLVSLAYSTAETVIYWALALQSVPAAQPAITPAGISV